MQFGLAIIPLFFNASSGFTSGTTNGTSLSILNAEELSTTTAPALTADGANSFDLDAPAENNAISIFLKES